MLAALIDDPNLSRSQMTAWAADLDNWASRDAASSHRFDRNRLHGRRRQCVTQEERLPILAAAGFYLGGRGERIRTSDLSVPNRALYQAEPRPDK